MLRGFSFFWNRSGIYVQPAIAQDRALAVAPDDFVAKEAAQPDKKTKDVLHRQQTPLSAKQGIIENEYRSGGSGGGAKHQGRQQDRPGRSPYGAEKHSQRQWVRENLSPIPSRTGTACASRPAQTMSDVVQHRLAANVVVNDCR